MKPQSTQFGPAYWQAVLNSEIATMAYLEAFAHLEFVGARWILQVPHTHWTAELHEHVNDEFNHFQILHEEALSMQSRLPASEYYRSSQMMMKTKAATVEYLNKLWFKTYKEIFKVASFRNEPHLLYSAVTMIIERRLMKIYPHILAQASSPSLLKTAQQIVEDEKNHLMLVKSLFHQFLPEENTEQTKRYFGIEEEIAQKWLTELAAITEVSLPAVESPELPATL